MGRAHARAHGNGEEALGWLGGQLLQPESDPHRRVIVGTWKTRDDWKEWHTDPRFQETRAELNQLVRGPEECS